ncbi:DUF3784 domain-containing protein [Cytobacillus firmus]|jgi:hypothetical protein|uniref:DUF3784 domain-containing protein n=1 Tax=Cytobacillus oceanisediminis TaxID=665099 RepID=UPI00203F276E|nr:DUF3784 domain-containing protein [Cytobacillus oceanisediminis]MCM3241924.1 DUF3784 domain-containing protein [Cytobacillus oceanisediminis]MCS0824511.1 DUF3784 domain-containing protein [Cytobacillus firmus]
MIGLVITQIAVIALFLILGWAVRFKKAYWLISGFASRPEEEKESLIENRYPQKIGSLLIGTAIGMLVLLPLSFTEFRFAAEAQFGFMLVILLGGLVYLSRYEVPAKRKRSYIIASILFIVTFGPIVYLTVSSHKGYEMALEEDSFEISGMYGDMWDYRDIQSVQLLEEMPEVTWKQNGIGLPTLAQGHFKVTGYGSSLLFIQKEHTPILYIEVKDEQIFVNSKDSSETQIWYEELKKEAEKQTKPPA